MNINLGADKTNGKGNPQVHNVRTLFRYNMQEHIMYCAVDMKVAPAAPVGFKGYF